MCIVFAGIYRNFFYLDLNNPNKDSVCAKNIAIFEAIFVLVSLHKKLYVFIAILNYTQS